MSLVTHKYTPAEMSDHELEVTFAARGHTVDFLLKAIRDQTDAGTLSSFVITGPRGAGKSTLIRMVDLEIRKDAKLGNHWMSIVFPEEQFNISSLRDFLSSLLEQLASSGVSEAADWQEKVEQETNDEQSEQLGITGLKEIVRASGKRLIVFVENLDLLLEDAFDDKMKGTLRRLLMSDPFMMIVGSSVHLFDSLKKYDEAFFNYFGRVRLDRLDGEQVLELLTKRAEYDGNERFLKNLPMQRAKIRAMVHLSGGNPRLILMLYELLSQRQVTTIVQYLRRLVDELTPLLKDEIERLPVQQRKIIHAMMTAGGTAKPADLKKLTRLPLNAITTQLKRLKDAQFIEVLGGGKGRAANYTVPDKLFSIWYQMRYLRQNRRRIELFVEVLRIWFDEEERIETLKRLAKDGRSETNLLLRESANTSEYFAASLKGTPYERAASDLCVANWIRVDIQEATAVYNDFFRDGQAAPPSEESFEGSEMIMWLLKHQDYKKAIEILDEKASEFAGDNPTLAMVLGARGFAKREQGDVEGAIADFSAVIELENAPVKQVAQALVNRGMTKGRQGDVEGAIADFSAVIELENAPVNLVAFALFGRGLAKGPQGGLEGAIADLIACMEMAVGAEDFIATAASAALVLSWEGSDTSKATFVSATFVKVVSTLSPESAREQILGLMSLLASRGQKDAWVLVFETLEKQKLSDQIPDALDFLKPVCSVLEGESRSILEALPPEQREFAEMVLKKFEENEKTSYVDEAKKKPALE